MRLRLSVFVAAFSILAAPPSSAPLALAQAHQGPAAAHRAAFPTLTMHIAPAVCAVTSGLRSPRLRASRSR